VLYKVLYLNHHHAPNLMTQIMKPLKLSLLAMVFLLSFISCSEEDMASEITEDYTIDLNLAKETNWEMAEEITYYINQHRASVGLNPIVIDQQHASAYAVEHTKYMIAIENMNHDNFYYRQQALTYQGAQRVGENVAFGYQDGQSVVRAWLNSPSHKRNIEGDYTHSGFGIVQNSNGSYYFTQLFYKN